MPKATLFGQQNSRFLKSAQVFAILATKGGKRRNMVSANNSLVCHRKFTLRNILASFALR
jgi:hypothetical protein